MIGTRAFSNARVTETRRGDGALDERLLAKLGSPSRDRSIASGYAGTQPGSRMDFVEVGGLRIAYERHGSGPPLVFLHGVLEDSRAWRWQTDEFSRDYTVVAWDAPGCGQSADPPETFRLSDYADCLAGVLEALELGPAHVLGLSWGGGLALEYYHRHPEMVRTLLLTGAYAGWGGSLPADIVEGRLQQALRESEMPPEQFVPGWLPGLLTEAAPQQLRDEVAGMMADFHPAGYRAMALGFAAADLRKTLPAIAVPTLLLWGEADRRAPLNVAAELHSSIPGSTLATIPGAGHICNAEAPEAFNREVRRFLGASGA